MKMEQFHVGQLVGYQGTERTIRRLYDNCVELEGDPVTKGYQALKPLEPRRGDRVRVVAIAPNSRFRELGVTVGAELTLRTIVPPTMVIDNGWPMVCTEEHPHLAPYGRVILLSRASPPAEVKERKCYGSQPSELPKTLPYVEVRGSHPLVRLEEKDRYVCEGGAGCCWIRACDIPWNNIEIQPAPTSAGEAVAAGWVPKVGDWVEGVGYRLGRMPNMALRGEITEITVGASYAMIQGPDCRPVSLERSSLKPISPPPAGSADAATREDAGAKPVGDARSGSAQPVGGGSLKPDPYAEHRKLEEAGRPPVSAQWAHHDRMRALAYLDHEDDELDRLAATRRAKLAQTKQAMDRPAAERHPTPSSMASSRGVVFGPLGEKQFHRSARRYWKRDEGHPSNWPSMPDVEEL